jgi:hypothetical protein
VRRDGEAESLSGSQVDEELKVAWLLNRQVGELGALGNPAHVGQW